MNSYSLNSKSNLTRYTTPHLTPLTLLANLGFIFDEHLTFSDQISSISKACYYHIRQLRCIRPYLDSTAACTIATCIVHSKLDYCNTTTYLSLRWLACNPAVLLLVLLLSCHITPVLRSLHWLKITERIKYKLLSLTCKVLTTTQPPYLHNLISVQPPRSIRSSSLVTLARPPTLSSSLRITDRCFRYASHCLWNQLPIFLSVNIAHSNLSISDLPVHTPTTFSRYVSSPLSASRFNTCICYKSVPPFKASGLTPRT